MFRNIRNNFSTQLTSFCGRKNVVVFGARSFSSFKKIKVSNPVVDLDGDEMTRVIWSEIKKKVDITLLGS